MNSLGFSGLAAICAASSNLAFRKSTSNSINSSIGYLFLFYLFSFLTALGFSPEILDVRFNPVPLFLGSVVGVLNVLLMDLTARALSSGPAGLTFAFQNAAAIFPAFVLYLFLSSDYGYSYHVFQVVGMMLVLWGLFWGAKNSSSSSLRNQVSMKWLKYVLLCFAVQILALTIMQGRSILFESFSFEGTISNWVHPDVEDVWFMPGMFGAALCIQSLLFFKEKRWLSRSEIKYGLVGGIANCGSTCMLLLATTHAMTAIEKGLLFPLFAIATIILCNLWASKLYHEKFNYISSGVCSAGIIISALG